MLRSTRQVWHEFSLEKLAIRIYEPFNGTTPEASGVVQINLWWLYPDSHFRK